MGASPISASTSARPSVTVDGQSFDLINEQILSFEMTEKEGGLSALELRLGEVGSVERGRRGVLLFESRDVVHLGSEIVAGASVDDEHDPLELFRGVVTALEIEFQSSSSPTLVVLAEDACQRARMARIRSMSRAVSLGFMPAAGSSRSNNFGCVASARAISRRRWSP